MARDQNSLTAEDEVFGNALLECGREVRKVFHAGQKVKFVGGCFAGKAGVVQANLPSGRVIVQINGTLPDENGRPVKAGGTFADSTEIQ